MYNFGHILVKRRQLPDQHVDSGPWAVQLCENNSGLNPPPPPLLPNLCGISIHIGKNNIIEIEI